MCENLSIEDLNEENIKDNEESAGNVVLVRRNSVASSEDNKITFSPPASIQRYRAVEKVLRLAPFHLKKVVEFGCAGLRFARNIKRTWQIEQAVFVDLDRPLLEENKFKIEAVWDDFNNLREKPLSMELYEGSVTEYNSVLDNTDAVICIELIEHLHPPDVINMTKNIFGNIQPKLVVITTPNKDFNVVFNMGPTEMRHWDHKFEWTKKEFKDWADSVTTSYPEYEVYCETLVEGPLGTESLGGCSQMAIFTRNTYEKKPVTVEHGEYKSVHEKQIFPYLTDDIIRECIVNFIMKHEQDMRSCGKDRHYFLNDDELKKTTVHYESFDLLEFKNCIPHKISKIRLIEALESLDIKYKWNYETKVIIFPYVEGEVEFEEEFQRTSVAPLEENWDDTCDRVCEMGNWDVDSEIIYKKNMGKYSDMEGDYSRDSNDDDEDYFDEDEFDYVTSDEPVFTVNMEKESSPNVLSESIHSSSLKRTNSQELLIESLPSIYSFNLEKSHEGTQTSIETFSFFSMEKNPVQKKPRLEDIEGFSFRDAIEQYNQKNATDSIAIESPKQSSTPKSFRVAEKDLSDAETLENSDTKLSGSCSTNQTLNLSSEGVGEESVSSVSEREKPSSSYYESAMDDTLRVEDIESTMISRTSSTEEIPDSGCPNSNAESPSVEEAPLISLRN